VAPDLHLLNDGQTDRALEIFDREMWPRPESLTFQLVDGSALLWRLHLRGVDAGERWAALADAWEAMAEDGFYAFNDMHAMMAFTAAGREASARNLREAMDRRAEGAGSNAAMTREVGLPAALGIQAFGRGAYGEAVDLLQPVPAKAHRFGGSNAQRDVIRLTLIEAARRHSLKL